VKTPAPEQEPLPRTVDIAGRLVIDGREEEALMVVGRMLDVLEERAKAGRRLRWRS
jgi:hypothetical protein